MVVDKRSSYNTIISRLTLNAIKTVVSTYHLMLKFMTESGMGTLQGDQIDARQCYSMSAIECSKKNDQEGQVSVDINTLYQIGEIILPDIESLKMLSDLN